MRKRWWEHHRVGRSEGLLAYSPKQIERGGNRRPEALLSTALAVGGVERNSSRRGRGRKEKEAAAARMRARMSHQRVQKSKNSKWAWQPKISAKQLITSFPIDPVDRHSAS